MIRHSKKVVFNGQKHNFGDIQADIIASFTKPLDGKPWQTENSFLPKPDRRASHYPIFSNAILWRYLIISDGRGSYRLDEGLSSIADHQPITT